MTHLREEPEIVKLGEAESGTVVAGVWREGDMGKC